MTIPFAETKIKHINNVRALPQADAEVVRLHIAMNVELVVDVLQSQQHLLRKHADRLQRKLEVAVLKHVLQTRSEQFHHHHVVRSLDAVVVHRRDSDASLERSIHLVLPRELLALRSHLLELDSHFFAYCRKNISKQTVQVVISVPR